jgi:23S rRNA pseudouridine1911/1915/1917 synthase
MKKILKADSEKRIDIFVSEKIKGFTRAYIQKLIKNGSITVNDNKVKPSFKLKMGDIVKVKESLPEGLNLKKENKSLRILYEDKHLLVVDKEAGVTVHPVGSRNENTLVNRLLFHVKDLSGIGGVIRPGIVHRLDKDTSGLLIVAKNNETHLKLSEMLKIHDIDRKYIALVKGHFDVRKGTIDLPISRKRGEVKMYIAPFGKRAITHFKVIEGFGTSFSLLALQLETGRTHQIRVHLAYLGHPVVGDPLYGGRMKDISLERQFLHAYEISFIHPIMKNRITVYSMIPEDLREILNLVRIKWKKK